MIEKFLPKNVQAIWPQVQELLKDKEIANDIALILDTVEKELDNTAKKSCGSDKKLRTAFNDASACVSVGKGYVKGSIPKLKAAGLAMRKNELQDNFQYIAKAGMAKHPVTEEFKTTMMNNKTCIEAVQRIALKTDGKVFLLEDAEDGAGKATELLSGRNLSFIIPAENYKELKEKLGIVPTKKAAGGNPPKP